MSVSIDDVKKEIGEVKVKLLAAEDKLAAAEKNGSEALILKYRSGHRAQEGPDCLEARRWSGLAWLVWRFSCQDDLVSTFHYFFIFCVYIDILCYSGAFSDSKHAGYKEKTARVDFRLLCYTIADKIYDIYDCKWCQIFNSFYKINSFSSQNSKKGHDLWCFCSLLT